jgi:uncharacterized repeat protein (TIGR03803 family)
MNCLQAVRARITFAPTCGSANLSAIVALILFVILGPGINAAGAASYSESVLYSFCSQGGTNCTDGSIPFATLVQAHDGNFYGTTAAGGTNAIINHVSNGDGVVFQLMPDGTYTVLHNFCSQGGAGCTDGAVPTVLTEGPDGSFYSTTELGGANGKGTVFKIAPDGTFTTLYSFCSTGGSSCIDGAIADKGMTLGSDGNFYGTTNSGGAHGGGTIYMITPSGVLTTLYNFCSQSSCTDGSTPLAPPIEGSDGNFYGTTFGGGAHTAGTVYKMTPSFVLTTLYSFCSQGGAACTDGSSPYYGVVEGTDGNFYGVTQNGGSGQFSSGTLFDVSPSGTLTTLHSFCTQGGSSCTDGAIPNALRQGTDLNFYGTTQMFGGVGVGNAFSITPSGVLTVLHSFCSQIVGQICVDGGVPEAGLIQGNDGNFYGDAQFGGSGDQAANAGSAGGTAFKLAVSPTLAAPIQLSLSPSQINLGDQVTLSWSVYPAPSMTQQQCFAFVQGGATGAGTWTGLQSGTSSAATFSGSTVITPTAIGTYTYALTCGGTESGFTTLTVNSASPTSTPTATDTATATATTTLTATPTATPTPTEGSEELVVNPSKIDFGTVSVGTTSAAQTVTITNGFNDDTVDFFASFIMGNFVEMSSTCGSTLGPLQSCQLEFACRPKTTGSFIGAYAFLYGSWEPAGMDGDDLRRIGVALFTCTGG